MISERKRCGEAIAKQGEEMVGGERATLPTSDLFLFVAWKKSFPIEEMKEVARFLTRFRKKSHFGYRMDSHGMRANRVQ